MPAGPHVGARIRRARKLLGLTQQELAAKVGVSRNTVDSWENDRAYPKRYDVALEQVLGIDLSGEPARPGPLDDLLPVQEPWEQTLLDMPGPSDDLKRQTILRGRDERRRQRAERESGRSAGQAAG